MVVALSQLSAWEIAGIVAGALTVISLLSGILYRIFVNLLLFVGVVVLSSVALAFILSVALMIGVPFWCGFTGYGFDHFVHVHLIGK